MTQREPFTILSRELGLFARVLFFLAICLCCISVLVKGIVPLQIYPKNGNLKNIGQ